MHVTTDHHPKIDLTIDQAPTTVMKSGTEAVGLGHNPILTYTTTKATVTPTETILGHTTGTADAITGVLPSIHTQMLIHIALTMTPRIGDYPCTEAFQLTLETAADHDLNQHINHPRGPCTKILHNPGNPTVLHTLRETP